MIGLLKISEPVFFFFEDCLVLLLGIFLFIGLPSHQEPDKWSSKLAEGGGNAGELPLSNDTLIEMSLLYAILCAIIVDILDGSAYLFDKEVPERVSTGERLAHLEQLIASVEKGGVEGIQTEVGKNSLDDG